MRKLVIGLQVLLGLMFLFSAVSKLTGGADDIRADLEIASWFWVLTALVELIGAAALLISLKIPTLATPAGLWIVALMSGAVVAHLRVGDVSGILLAPVMLLAIALFISITRADEFGAINLARPREQGSDEEQATL